MKTVIVFLLSIFVAVPVLAQAPVNGTYKTTDLGGLMLPGHYSEYWAAGTKLAVGNTMNEESWDGATLGTQWRFSCPQVIGVALLLDQVDGAGNGQKIWRLTYTGGAFWLDGAGPWGGGDASYSLTVDSWAAIVTEQFANFAEVRQIRSISAQATFVGYETLCLALQVQNTERLDDTGTMGLPADFPMFLDGNSCGTVPAGAGEWGDVSQITFTVDGCETVPVHQASWGQVKQLYSE
jgi:hypothetical protein